MPFPKAPDPAPGRYIVLISVHGLVRGEHLELGRDADTGGQIKYVIELARALGTHPEVARVDLLTRRIIDPKVSEAYARPEEPLNDKARIVRLAAGPRRYFRKEVLWPYLNAMIDQALLHIRGVGRLPDVIHAHYADAGFVGARLAGLLGVPFLFTAHSLGRVKRHALQEQGLSDERLESRFRISRRIEAEEDALATAARVIVSTSQEIDEQYTHYDHYRPDRKVVIAPGVDLSHFRPPKAGEPEPAFAASIDRFLVDPAKPLILALSRPDGRKNLHGLVEAFALHAHLRDRANLAIIAGSREDIEEMDRATQRVLTRLLLQIDRYDLYGKVAYPKRHRPDEVPEIFRLAAMRRGVFALPTLHELFGLTLLEAAASGLPLVATRNGGPAEIVPTLENGLLVDPTDTEALGEALFQVLDDPEEWQRRADRGVVRSRQAYSWTSHVERYLEVIREVEPARQTRFPVFGLKSRLPTVDRLVVSDIDNTLLGDDAALEELLARLRHESRVGFGIATGRHIDSAVEVLLEHGVPLPDVLITSVGCEIHYGPSTLVADAEWPRHIDYRWRPAGIRAALSGIPGLRLQPEEAQRRHKVSFLVDEETAPSIREIKGLLRRGGLSANVVFSHGEFLDVLPVRTSKGRAVRYVAMRWGIPIDRVLVAGDSGNDRGMLVGNTLGVVVGNYSKELEDMRKNQQVYFAQGHHAAGILEGMAHFEFLTTIRVPAEAVEEDEDDAQE